MLQWNLRRLFEKHVATACDRKGVRFHGCCGDWASFSDFQNLLSHTHRVSSSFSVFLLLFIDRLFARHFKWNICGGTKQKTRVGFAKSTRENTRRPPCEEYVVSGNTFRNVWVVNTITKFHPIALLKHFNKCVAWRAHAHGSKSHSFCAACVWIWHKFARALDRFNLGIYLHIKHKQTCTQVRCNAMCIRCM